MMWSDESRLMHQGTAVKAASWCGVASVSQVQVQYHNVAKKLVTWQPEYPEYPFIFCLLPDGMGVIQDDNARINWAHIVKDWFREYETWFPPLDWSPQSSDIKPLEKLWVKCFERALSCELTLPSSIKSFKKKSVTLDANNAVTCVFHNNTTHGKNKTKSKGSPTKLFFFFFLGQAVWIQTPLYSNCILYVKSGCVKVITDT